MYRLMFVLGRMRGVAVDPTLPRTQEEIEFTPENDLQVLD